MHWNASDVNRRHFSYPAGYRRLALKKPQTIRWTGRPQ